jgi:Flp pilus assembly pilin Flp
MQISEERSMRSGEAWMIRILRGLWSREEGQGLAEYTLLLCLLVLTGVATMSGMASRINNICFRTSAGMAMASAHASLSAGSSDNASQGSSAENSVNKNELKLY